MERVVSPPPLEKRAKEVPLMPEPVLPVDITVQTFPVDNATPDTVEFRVPN